MGNGPPHKSCEKFVQDKRVRITHAAKSRVEILISTRVEADTVVADVVGEEELSAAAVPDDLDV